MNNVNKAYTQSLSRVLDDSTRQWYACLRRSGHRAGIDMQVLFFLLNRHIAHVIGLARWKAQFHSGRIMTLGGQGRVVWYCSAMLKHRAGKGQQFVAFSSVNSLVGLAS